MKTIALTRGKSTIVDDDDYEKLSQYKWCYNSHGYAVRVPRINGEKRHTIYMHREILNTPQGMPTDHINRNKLDNRKSNLRITTPSHNQFNRNVPSNNRSGYKGVVWFSRTGRWKVNIGVNGKNIHLGYYADIKDAVRVRTEAEAKYYAGI